MAIAQSNTKDDPAILVCEHILKSTLKSPLSYRRDIIKLEYNTVMIRYDAQNPYGVMLRDVFGCEFDIDEKDDKFSAYPIGFSSARRKMISLTEKATSAKIGVNITREEAQKLVEDIEDSERQMRKLMSQFLGFNFAAMELGGYPILKSTTALRMPPAN